VKETIQTTEKRHFDSAIYFKVLIDTVRISSNSIDQDHCTADVYTSLHSITVTNKWYYELYCTKMYVCVYIKAVLCKHLSEHVYNLIRYQQR